MGRRAGRNSIRTNTWIECPGLLAVVTCMKALLVSVLLLALLGCATGLVEPAAGAGQPGGKVFTFQQKSLAPASGAQMIEPSELRTADIVLSAESSPLSSGIRFFTMAPVSHAALYVGDGQVAEALGGGVRLRTVEKMRAEESVIAVFRHPRLDEATAQRIAAIARGHVGKPYDYVGTFLHLPYALERTACELPLLPGFLRGACVSLIAGVQLSLAGPGERFFCSSFVLDAYRDAGAPITKAEPKWISPADIMHMREGDVSPLPVEQRLVYVGHLKPTPWALDAPVLQMPIELGPARTPDTPAPAQ
jgi:cell wall-associated NlpC family hydrolase